jgi:hypothetical protein
MRALKNIAVEEDGFIPDFSQGFVTNILNSGLAYSIPASRITRRETLGLPPLPKTNIDNLKKLVELAEVPGFTEEQEE